MKKDWLVLLDNGVVNRCFARKDVLESIALQSQHPINGIADLLLLESWVCSPGRFLRHPVAPRLSFARPVS